jgi:4-amino-4-deoxy-L-arabinose transferase-like glycosyltransferase
MRDEQQSQLGFLMATALLCLAGIMIYFYHVSQTDIYNPQAAQVAVHARHIQETGYWLSPNLHDQSHTPSPPLYPWLIQLTASLKTEITNHHGRIPGATAAVLMMLLTALLLYRHINRYQRDDDAGAPVEGFSLLAGLILGSSPLLYIAGRSGTPDALYALFYFISAFCMTESLEARRSFYASHSPRMWLILGYVFIGLAMLTNGPLALYMLWIPYLLTARSYRLRKFDWVHLPGTLIALFIGAAWLFGGSGSGSQLDAWMQFWIPGNSMIRDGSVGRFTVVYGLLISTLPWVILALVMIYRIQSRKDRSPALVYWNWSLFANSLLIILLAPRIGNQTVMLLPFLTLLAVDGIYRWNFESQPWSTIWRRSMRVILTLFILAGIFTALLLHSILGLVMFILAAVSWIFWIVWTYGRRLMYSPWDTAIRIASITVILILAAEVLSLSDWVPRRRYHIDTLMFFDRVNKRIDEDNSSHLIFQAGNNPDPDRYLHDYHLHTQTGTLKQGMEIEAVPGLDQYVYIQNADIAHLPAGRYIPVAYDFDEHGETREIVFRVDAGTTAPLDQPTRIAMLGNTGTRRDAQRDVSKRLGKRSRHQPLDHAVLLGNNVYGPSFFDHLDFTGSFLRPNHDLLRDGVMFHGVLGHEDQSYAWLQSRYQPFHMYGQRYYSSLLDNGRTELFVLDTARSDPARGMDKEQLAWFKKALMNSDAQWKIVGLYSCLLSRVAPDLADSVLAGQLMPVFSRYDVNLVCWSGGKFYERQKQPGSSTLFLNCGWSGSKGSKKLKEFTPGSGFYSQDPGYVWIETSDERLTWQAVTKRNLVVDEGEISGVNGMNPDPS